MREYSNPPAIHHPVGKYSHVVKTQAREMVYLSGQVSVDKDGKLVGEGDFSTQLRKCYENIGGALASVGASFANIVQLTTYVVGREHLPAYLETRTAIFQEIYTDGNYPAHTFLFVAGLLEPEMLVEVCAVAALDG